MLGVVALKLPDDLVIYNPLPICWTLALVKLPLSIIACLKVPKIDSPVTVVLESKEVGVGLIKPRFAWTAEVLVSLTVTF